MTPKRDYLSKVVYLRKGTRIVVPDTQVNQKDANLVPMTVAEAIKLGYLADPLANQNQDTEEARLAAENARLAEMIQNLQAQQAESMAAIKELTSKLSDAEAVIENKVSIGQPTPTEPVNLAADAGETGLEEIEAEVIETQSEPAAPETQVVDTVQADLDALFATTNEGS